MSSTANANVWENLSGSVSLGFEGYSLDFSKDGDDKDAAAPAVSVPATTSTYTDDKSSALDWVKKNPLAVGVGVVAVLAFAALSMGRK